MKSKKARSRSSKPAWQQDIAKERIGRLNDLASKEFSKHPERSDRYGELAKKIAMRYNVRIPSGERKTCRGCGKYLVPGENCVIRANSRLKAIETKCLSCGRVTRRPYPKGDKK